MCLFTGRAAAQSPASSSAALRRLVSEAQMITISGEVGSKDAVQTVDVAVIGGVGYAAGSFGVEARFEAGLRDLNKDLGSDITVKSRAVRINVTWTP